MQTLGIQQFVEKAIRIIIVDRMLADIQDRIDSMEPKSVTKLYEIGVKHDTRHPPKQCPVGNWRNRAGIEVRALSELQSLDAEYV